MKKQMIFLTVLSALACMTGCGTDTPAANTNSTTQAAVQTTASASPVSTEAETTAAISTALQSTENAATAAQTTAANTTATSKAGAKKLSLDSAQALFGGYVATKDDAALNLRSEPSTSAESLAMIPCETQLGIFSDGTKGWYLTEFQGKVGYVKAEFIKEIQPHDPAIAGDITRGGYISANGSSVKVMSGTGSVAEVLIEIPDGTQIIYYTVEPDKKWSVVNYKEKIGYVETKYIKEIENYDPAVGQNGSTLNLKDMVGEWYYMNPDSTVGSVINISADGKFSETTVVNNNMTNGKVEVKNNTITFYDGDNHLYYVFTPDAKNPKEYLDDNPEDGRLVPASEYNKPNADGFYDPVLLPVTSISAKALCGTWKNADGKGEVLEINEGRSLQHSRFILKDASGSEVRGDVRIQYLVNQGGDKEYCFTFYEDSGKFRFAMDAVDTIQLTDLYGYQSGEPHFVKQ